jgi:endonuclease YncB( thermonuclease family)
MKWVIIAAFFCLFATQSQASTYCYVERVIDGDTIALVILNRSIEGKVKSVVRMANIDAPELGQAFGPQALKALKKKCGGQFGWLFQGKIEMYGRTLGTLHYGQDINLWMVQQGFAHPYKGAPKSYFSAARKAIKARKGMWASNIIVDPALYRKDKQAKGMSRNKWLERYS